MSTPIRVLIAEDNPADAELVLRELRRAGFEPEWERVDTEAAYLDRLHTNPDIILSDYDMPQFGGPRALALLKERGLDIPFIIISGTIGEDVAVDVMKLGASDYLLKDRLMRLEPAIHQALEQARLRKERKQAGEALRQSEAEFRAMTEASPLGILVADCDGLATYTNVTLRQILGVGFQEMAGEGWAGSVHPLDRSEVLAKWQEAVAGKKSFEGIIRFVRPDGRTIHASMKTAVMREGVRVLGYVGVVEDITERRQAGEALRRSEMSLAAAQTLAKVGSWETDLATYAVTWSAEAFHIFETSPDQFQPSHEGFLQFVHPEDRVAVNEAFTESFTQKDPCMIEHRLLMPDGRIKTVEERWHVFMDEQGRPLRAVGTCQDITERTRAEELLRLLGSAVEQSKESILITDAELDLPGPRIVFVNPAFSAMTGYSAQEVIGKTPRILQGPRTDRAVLDRLRQNLGRGETFEGEAIQYRKDGTEFPMEWQIAPLRSAAGNITHFVAIQRDITERKRAETALSRLAAIVESSDDAIIGKDLNSLITSWNKGAEKIFGYTASEMVGTSMMRLTPAVRWEEEKQILGKIQRGERVEHFETQRENKNGRLIDIAITVSPIKDAAGQIVGVSKVARDITERKRGEGALRESEERTRMLVQSANIGLWDWNLVTNEVFFSAEWKSQLGYTDAEMPGRYEEWMNRLHPEDRAAALAAVEEYIDGRRAEYDVEFRLRHKDGSWRSILARAKLTCNETGQPVHIMGCHIDITERKRTEARFRRLVESNAQGVMFFKTSGEITGANDAYLRLTGYSREDLEAGRMNWIAMTPPEFTAVCQHCMKEIAAKGVCAPFEKEYLRKDGSHVPVFISAASFEDNPEEGVCFVLDLTERKQFEKQFLRAQRMESIGTLASGVAHDLNNILAPIMMSVPVLRMELSAEARERIITTIEMSAERGAQVVRQVLTFGRGLEGEKLPLQVGALIDEIVKIMGGTFPKDITIERSIATGLWTVLGDATQLHQVLLNLCVNARDAMPDGGRLRLRASNLDIDTNYSSMLPESKPGPHVLIEVSDSGRGIPPETLERIFDPFFTTKEVGKGTGLGLSTVHGIVKNHGGFIKVESELGKGTTFQVWLPAVPDQPTTAITASGTVSPAGHGELVLVVDDEPAVASAVRTVLEPHGYRVLLASDGTEALAVFAQNSDSIALVLTDIMMPHMNGVALVRALQRMKPGIPVIASTGLGEKAHLAELKTMGIETFLSKPYNADTLLRTIHGVLRP